MAEERLQKILSRAGIASRRKAEQLILEGRVTVNGRVVDKLGTKADPSKDDIRVDGVRVKPPKRLAYYALYKPKNVITSLHDPRGRPTVKDFLTGIRERVFPVGRLDYHSEGLLLLTNDGDFANLLTGARSTVPKTYLVKVNGMLSPQDAEKFRQGVPLFGRRTAPVQLRLVKRAANPWYEVQLTRERQNQIRLMFKHFGLLVEKLKRVRIGAVKLGTMKPGELRELKPAEVEALKRAALGQEK